MIGRRYNNYYKKVPGSVHVNEDEIQYAGISQPDFIRFVLFNCWLLL